MADNLGILLVDACRKFAVQPALEEKDNTVSYSQLSALSGKVASILRGYGLMRDEPVLVPVANEARDVAAFIGVWLAGGVVVPVARHSPAIVVEATRAVCGARFLRRARIRSCGIVVMRLRTIASCSPMPPLLSSPRVRQAGPRALC
jgi:acyl-CoA synthetase (AMP-forming)/AMP-acid ligase II